MKSATTDIPAYVPGAVRLVMAARLDGDAWEPTGWAETLEKAETEVLSLQRRMTAAPDGVLAYKLGVEHARAVEHRDAVAAEVVCLRRLLQDPQMKAVYFTLAGLPDEKAVAFVQAARMAWVDHDRQRRQTKAQAAIAREIGRKARGLVASLRKAEGNGEQWPGEFFSIPALLEATEHDPGDRNAELWPSLKRSVLGEGDGGRRYAWNTAPDVANLIDAIQRAAEGFSPSLKGPASAALATRQHSPKMEYLRAFVALLRDEHGFMVDADVVAAIATTATVVLGVKDKNAAVDAADVRRAISTLSADRR